MNTDETFVIGADENNEIKFFRSFKYKEQKEEAQAALLIAQEYPIWFISRFRSGWKLVSEDTEKPLTFNIPSP